MKNFRRLVGEKIKAVRLKSGLSQSEIATKLGVDNSRVSDWERGAHLPEGALKAGLLKILNQEDSLIDIPDPASQGQVPALYQPTPEEMSRVFHALTSAIPERRLLGLYLLTGHEPYYEQALALPDAVRLARVLKKYTL